MKRPPSYCRHFRETGRKTLDRDEARIQRSWPRPKPALMCESVSACSTPPSSSQNRRPGLPRKCSEKSFARSPADSEVHRCANEELAKLHGHGKQAKMCSCPSSHHVDNIFRTDTTPQRRAGDDDVACDRQAHAPASFFAVSAAKVPRERRDISSNYSPAPARSHIWLHLTRKSS